MIGPEETNTLLAQVAMADRAAFEALYSDTSSLLYGMCLHILEDETEAEMVLQDVFSDIWVSADDLRRTPLTADLALVHMVRGKAIALKRARQSHPHEVNTRDLLPGGSEHLDVEEDDPAPAGTLEQAMGALNPARALLLRRAILQGEGYSDLAVATDLDEPTVRQSLQRTLLKLSHTIDDVAPLSDAETVLAAEVAIGLTTTTAPTESSDLMTKLTQEWAREVAQMVIQDTAPLAPPPQLWRRLQADVFGEKQETLWDQFWPYAVGGILAAIVLWIAIQGDLLIALN